jgi:hypothetical protein
MHDKGFDEHVAKLIRGQRIEGSESSTAMSKRKAAEI